MKQHAGEIKQKVTMTSLGQMQERPAEVADHFGRVSIGTVVEVVEQKPFGSLLLLAGIITFFPLSGIPGVPTPVAMILLLTAGQLLVGHQHFRLPLFLQPESAF